MAGNTKFIGFGNENTVTFERWGGRASVSLPAEAVGTLRKVCYEMLPTKPPVQAVSVPRGEWRAEYDGSTGRVLAVMSPSRAKQLAELIARGGMGTKEENCELAEQCSKDLESCYRDHLDFIETSEPGAER